MPRCDLRLDSPPKVLADCLHEAGWTLVDLLEWWDALLAAYLIAGGLEQLPHPWEKGVEFPPSEPRR